MDHALAYSSFRSLETPARYRPNIAGVFKSTLRPKSSESSSATRKWSSPGCLPASYSTSRSTSLLAGSKSSLAADPNKLSRRIPRSMQKDLRTGGDGRIADLIYRGCHHYAAGSTLESTRGVNLRSPGFEESLRCAAARSSPPSPSSAARCSRRPSCSQGVCGSESAFTGHGTLIRLYKALGRGWQD